MQMTNRECDQRISVLENALDLDGYLGYAIATNYKRMSDVAEPYLKLRNEFFSTHDMPEPDLNGFINVAKDSQLFAEFMQGPGRVMDDLHEVDIIKVKPSELPPNITARQLLSLYWMVGDE